MKILTPQEAAILRSLADRTGFIVADLMDEYATLPDSPTKSFLNDVGASLSAQKMIIENQLIIARQQEQQAWNILHSSPDPFFD